MVQELKNEPFVLLGVNSDEDRDVLAKRLKDDKISWRSAVDGSTQGPISSRWNIKGWPTTFVIDPSGKIRHRSLRGKQLMSAVRTLLAEHGVKRRQR